jgi:8-oxo-dGTP pyrophosphatase MutT (NUDIX family)
MQCMNSDTPAVSHGTNATLKPEQRTVHYRGRVITVSTDLVQLPNGRRAELEVVQHPGGAAAVAVDQARRVCLLRQYRYVAGGWLWELPAGKLEPREPPLATAQRELAEEAGVSGREWRPLGTCLSSPGVFTEVLHLYLATGIGPAPLAHERAEVIEIHWVPLETACEWALGGTIADCKTVVGLLRARFGPAGALS